MDTLQFPSKTKAATVIRYAMQGTALQYQPGEIHNYIILYFIQRSQKENAAMLEI